MIIIKNLISNISLDKMNLNVKMEADQELVEGHHELLMKGKYFNFFSGNLILVNWLSSYKLEPCFIIKKNKLKFTSLLFSHNFL